MELESDSEEIIRLLSMPMEQLEEEIKQARSRGAWMCGCGIVEGKESEQKD